MTIENVLFVLLFGLIAYNNGVQAYIHFNAYPLLEAVKADFGIYLAEYEKRLTIPLLAPYGLTLLINFVLLFLRPANLSLVAVIVLLVLNLAVATVTMTLATPVYSQLKQNGFNVHVMSRLMNINLIRLGLSTAASFVALYFLATLLG